MEKQLLTFLITFSLLLSGCQPVCQKIEPIVICPLPAQKIETLPSAFQGFSSAESQEEWAREIVLGNAFAKECDFYRAITCYKRALILLPSKQSSRRMQIDYDLILCYYLGNKYQDALNIFEASALSQAGPDFPAFNNLLLIVYDSYLQAGHVEKASCLLEVINKFSPESAEDLNLYQAIKAGELEETRYLISLHREKDVMECDFAFYEQFAKSAKKARLLNAILPGAGYYYIGQRRSALTSFIINTLFIAAAYQFFNRGYPAAGAITASIEAGWYMGGINGAGIEAHEFNTRLFEGVGRKILSDSCCFPVLMFETSF